MLTQKFKKKTGIVSGFVVLLSILGMMTSVGMVINQDKNWYIGLISALLLLSYFAVDKIAIKLQLKKQKEFFLTSNLNKITKVKITLDENNNIAETFYHKEKIIGTNNYSYNNLTAFKIENENIYLIYNDESVVLVKKSCLTEKTLQEFLKLKNKFINIKKKVKK